MERIGHDRDKQQARHAESRDVRREKSRREEDRRGTVRTRSGACWRDFAECGLAKFNPGTDDQAIARGQRGMNLADRASTAWWLSRAKPRSRSPETRWDADRIPQSICVRSRADPLECGLHERACALSRVSLGSVQTATAWRLFGRRRCKYRTQSGWEVCTVRLSKSLQSTELQS